MLALALLALARQAGPTVTATFPRAVLGQFTGRIYLYVSKDPTSEPRLGPDWRDAGPILAVNVRLAKADTEIALDDAHATVEAGRLSSLPPGEYTFQAVIDRNPASAQPGTGDGNLCSLPVRAQVKPGGAPVKLVCDQDVDEPAVHPTATVSVAEFESVPLTRAQRRLVVWRATVVVPSDAGDAPSRTFPILVDIPDRNDSYADYPDRGSNRDAYRNGKPFVYVRLDPVSPTGYHVMVDSASNGPYASALVGEFLPYIAKEYHGDMGHVLVTGEGSGGWSALWLEVTQPKVFSGCWAFNPDSVDFHALHGLNIYTSANAYRSASGAPRPWTRGGDDTWQHHAEVEAVLRGLRIAGMESDFSPRAKNGRPSALFNRKTGLIYPTVAKAWQAFDLAAQLASGDPHVVRQLAERIHIQIQANDADFRSDAVRLLQAELNKLDAHANISWGVASDGNADRIGTDPESAQAEAAAAYPRG